MINYALASNGSTATANKAADLGSLANIINGSRVPGGSFATNGLQLNGSTAWLEIAFNATRLISEIDVIFATSGDLNNSGEPTLSTLGGYGAAPSFAIQYWNGSSWTTIQSVTGNDKQWRQFTFSAVSTTKIKLDVTATDGGALYFLELEAWGEGPPSITSSSPLPTGTQGLSYNEQLSADGGVGSLTWSEQGVLTGIPPGISLSDGGLLSGIPTTAGTYTFTIEVEDTIGGSDSANFSLTINEPSPLPYGFTQAGVELFCEAEELGQSNGTNVSEFNDQSAHARHLTTNSDYPTFQTGVVNGKAVVRWNGSQKPLSNNATFTIRCGWILAKYNGATFPDDSNGYKGLLTDLITRDILVGDRNSDRFFNLGYDYYEFRLNDRIHPQENAVAPMSTIKLIFFRFWTNFTMIGVQLGQQRDLTNRKWMGDVALLILASRDYCEQDIRARSADIASAYGLTLADVYPYQADRNGTSEASEQSINFYDPPEGERISEVLDNPKRVFDLSFSSRRANERAGMKSFHSIHYAPSLPCIYRNYNVIPPEDIEGYIDSPYKLEGGLNNYTYSFRFREK